MSRLVTLVVVFAIFAFTLMIAAFLTPAWQNETEESTDGQTLTTLLVGLREFRYKITHSNEDGSFASSEEWRGPLTVGDLVHIRKTPTSEHVDTITPPLSEMTYKIIGSVLDDSVKARDGVTGSGTPAVVFGVLFLLCFALTRRGKGPGLCRHLGLVFLILAILCTFVGVFLYSEVLDVGACLVVWTGFCIFAALVGFFAGNISGSTRSRYAPMGFWLSALLLAAVALGVPRWMSQTREVLKQGIPDYTERTFLYSGVSAYGSEVTRFDAQGTLISSETLKSTFHGDTFTYVTVKGGATSSSSYTKCSDYKEPCGLASLAEATTFEPFKQGADEILGCGIAAVLFLLAAGVGLFAMFKGKGPHFIKIITAVCAFAAAGFGFLGLVLYSAQTSVGYSFILYSGAGFFWVLVFVLAVFLLDPSTANERVGLLGK